MGSTFTWLDYSEHERQKMLDVIELFGEKTTRDELGLGGVRDAFADLLFPGTSTIQTRAKYFLFVPWIYLLVERKQVPSASVAQRARKLEAELMNAIEESGDREGLIGRLAKENVRRLASSVYWNGLQVFGIRTYSGSQDQYHRSLDQFYARRQTRQTSHREFEGEAIAEPERLNWHSGLPVVPDGFPQTASFALEVPEADYLRESIVTRCPRSLLALMLRERIPAEGPDFAWELEAALPDHLTEQVKHGRNFSEIMLGAQLLYNLMLAEMCKMDAAIDEYQGLINTWWSTIEERQAELTAWDRRRFWQIVYTGNPRVSPRAQQFVNQWCDLVLNAAGADKVLQNKSFRDLIDLRESQLKRGLARLHNERAREIWQGESGAAQMDLRWRSAQRIVKDIQRGLEGTNHA